MGLEAALRGRDNNLNLIRVLAAWAVLWSHSYIVTGHAAIEPFKAATGISLGSMAVDVFFFVSGLLVTASAHQRGVVSFVRSRMLRIYPAAVTSAALTILVVGVWFTALPAGAFFAHGGVLSYLTANSTLVAGVSFGLPGAFSGNSVSGVANGSIWTLPIEVRLYGALAISCLLSGFAGEGKGRILRAVCLVLWAYAAFRLLTTDPMADSGARMQFLFFTGSVAYLTRKHIPILPWLGALCFVAILGLTVVSAWAYTLMLPYVILCAAYGPTWRTYNRLGDYSYGTYIYAFPCQQIVAALVPGIGVMGMVMLATPLTLACAATSWRWIEEPALRLKQWKPQPKTATSAVV